MDLIKRIVLIGLLSLVSIVALHLYFNTSSPYVYTIFTKDKTKICNGIPVAPETIITADHCIGNNMQINIDNNIYELDVIKRVQEHDLAILSVIDYEFYKYVKLNDNHFWGYLYGNGCIYTNKIGRLLVYTKSMNSMNKNRKQYEYISDIYFSIFFTCRGDSGGPILSYNGELMGIQSLYGKSIGGYAFFNYAIPARDIKRVLEDADILIRE